MRPSWGLRFSAMSMLAMIFRRLIRGPARCSGCSATGRSTPSTRNRTRSPAWEGSTWMSEARISSASWNMAS